MLRADSPLRFLKGVGPRRADALAALGLETVEDLLYVLPFRYEDRRSFARIGDLDPARGAEVTLLVRVDRAALVPTRRRGFSVFKAIVRDDTGSIPVVWFNQAYLERTVAEGKRLVLWGRCSSSRYEPRFLDNPEVEPLDEDDAETVHTGRIVPVYRKLGELSSRAQRRLVHSALAELEPGTLTDLLPAGIGARHGLLARAEALRELHFPSAGADLEALAERRTPAQRSLAFDEAFLLQLALALRRQGVELERRERSYSVTDALRTRLAALLPFKLTAAQRRVLGEIASDLRAEHPMNRLLQGDVGSGKTIVALLALLVAIDNGYQAALMAPTEILAEQHFRTIRRLLDRAGLELRTVMLTGALRPAARRGALETLASGVGQLAIGTHALFESGVEFRSLGLVVIDEQHRFGVLQRHALARKGTRPDVLVMTATPIPRTLALTLYGDLDLSVLDELPPGRTAVTTVVRTEAERPKLYAFLRKEIAAGRQVYFVVPLVEETEKSDLKAAKAFAEELRRDVFPDFEVGMLHGRLKSEEKERVMQRFAAGEIHVLVATTVVEVGIDVPNASVMVVEHAERFGLSQLHQLRGRVGRGAARSYCALMVGEGAGYGRDARERLATMETSQDGFRIAEKDLELRGPGAVFGTQQHGLGDLQFLALILRSPELVEMARAEAQGWLASVGRAEAEARLAGLAGKWRRRLELAQVG